jgi:glucose-6-phosphate isomerase
MSPLTDTPSWHALLAHREAMAGTTLDALWQRDPARGGALTFECAGIAVDFSKQRADGETLKFLTALARERDVPAGISTLFAGEKVNVTEGRPALHMALRGD